MLIVPTVSHKNEKYLKNFITIYSWCVWKTNGVISLGRVDLCPRNPSKNSSSSCWWTYCTATAKKGDERMRLFEFIVARSLQTEGIFFLLSDAWKWLIKRHLSCVFLYISGSSKNDHLLVAFFYFRLFGSLCFFIFEETNFFVLFLPSLSCLQLRSNWAVVQGIRVLFKVWIEPKRLQKKSTMANTCPLCYWHITYNQINLFRIFRLMCKYLLYNKKRSKGLNKSYTFACYYFKSWNALK